MQACTCMIPRENRHLKGLNFNFSIVSCQTDNAINNEMGIIYECHYSALEMIL